MKFFKIFNLGRILSERYLNLTSHFLNIKRYYYDKDEKNYRNILVFSPLVDGSGSFVSQFLTNKKESSTAKKFNITMFSCFCKTFVEML